ncbi:MAG TPA: snapalysin family zinc-dependent metalloprotease [Streptosporangiaceae bacterium]
MPTLTGARIPARVPQGDRNGRFPQTAPVPGRARRRAPLLTAALLTGGAAHAAPAAPAAPHKAAVTTLKYDASGAEEFKQAVDDAAQTWNASVDDVHIEAGTPADFVVVADDGWPRTQPDSLGHGEIWMGREAVNDGYYVPRIATHEMGHILGLPDNRTGLCSDLMSGHSAPVDCKNDKPSAAEAAQVEQNFANGESSVRPGVMILDAPAHATAAH